MAWSPSLAFMLTGDEWEMLRLSSTAADDGNDEERLIPGGMEFLNNLDIFARTIRLGRTLYSDFSLASTDMRPSIQEMREKFMCAAVLYGAGRMILEEPINDHSLSSAIVVGIGEVLAPVLPSHFSLDGTESRNKLLAAVNALIRYSQFRDIFQGMNYGVLNTYRTRFDFLAVDTDYSIPWSCEIPSIRSASDAMRALVVLATDMDRADPNMALKCLTHVVIAAVRKGSVSGYFVEKIKEAFKTDLHVDLHLDKSLCLNIHRSYGKYVNSHLMRGLFNYWYAWVPENAKRLRVAIDKCQGEGLTAFMAVKDAMNTFPDFYWSELISLPAFSKEFTALIRTKTAVTRDRFFGFNRDLGDCSSRYYKNLATACAHILKELAGDERITRSLSFKTIFPEEARVNRLIEKYRSSNSSTELVHRRGPHSQ